MNAQHILLKRIYDSKRRMNRDVETYIKKHKYKELSRAQMETFLIFMHHSYGGQEGMEQVLKHLGQYYCNRFPVIKEPDTCSDSSPASLPSSDSASCSEDTSS